jgi:probable F420-dependent oxidoreductase
MKLGLALPNLTSMGTRDNLLNFAREAELLGYDSLWVTERLLYPLQPKQLMMGRPWPEVYKYSLDPLDTLVFVASVTEKIRLGTSVLDFPMYAPAPLAKRIATLDVLSNGRAVIGAGLGWSEDEFAASNAAFEKRGLRMTEMILALKVLWGPDPAEFHGKFYDVPATFFNPKPLQKPHPPLLIGGYAPEALRRAARLADGFNPVAPTNGADVERFFSAASRAWQEAGRQPAQPQIIVRVNHGYISEQPLGDGRQFLTGSVEQVRGDVTRLAALGASEVFFDVKGRLYQLPDAFTRMMEQVRLIRDVA